MKQVIPAMAILAAALALSTAVVSSQRAEKSVNEGVYSEDQAYRGEQLFETQCASCHEPGRFIGDSFIEVWAGKPLHALFDVVSVTMPEDNPGSLKPQQNADVVSYILQLNGFPTGPTELEGTEDAMRAVTMEAPRK